MLVKDKTVTEGKGASSLTKRRQGEWGDGFVGNGQTWQPEFGPWNPHGGRRDPTSTGCPLTYTHTRWHVHTHIIHKKNKFNLKKKKANPMVAQLPIPFHPPPALTGSSSRVTVLPAPSAQLQSQESNSGPKSKRLRHSMSQHPSSPNDRRQAGMLRNRGGGRIFKHLQGLRVYTCSSPCSRPDRKLSKNLLVCTKSPVNISTRAAPFSASDHHKSIPFAGQISVSACAETNWFLFG